MKSVLIVTLASCLSIAAFGQVVFKTHNLSKVARQTIIATYNSYQEKYHCLDSLVVTDSFINVAITENGELFSVYPSYNHIVINTAKLKESKYTMEKFKGDLAEEFFLTLAPSDQKHIEPFLLDAAHSNIDSVIAFRGLVIVAKGHRQYDCEVIEAAASNALAIPFAPVGFMKSYPGYQRMADAFSEMINLGWIAPAQLFACEKSSDIKGLVGIILKKQRDEVTTDDINLMINYLFDSYKNRTDDIAKEKQKIIQIRN